MKNFSKCILPLLAVILASCEDVIDVDVQTAPTRLTIEASLDWEKGTAGNEQTIKLGTSTPYFDTNGNTAVSGASVRVTNDTSGREVVFADQNDGTYTTSDFAPVVGQSYTLEVRYNGETYTATEQLTPVTDIKEINQSLEDGFSDEELEVNIIFDDPEDEENYYLFKFQEPDDLLPEFEYGDDEFVNGNEIEWYFEKEEDDGTDEIEAFVPGDTINIEFYGISEAYSNYMAILIDQLEGGGLFETTPVALKGNCINLTNPENYANGYFRLTQVIKTSYTFE